MKNILQASLNRLGYGAYKLPKSHDDIISENLNNNPIFFDIGANKGQSILRFKKINQNSEIHSFEPNKYNYRYLKKNFSKNCIINNYACGDKNSKKKFNIFKKDTNSSFLESKKFGKPIKSLVRCLKIDTYLKQNFKIDKIDLLKIDTQGYESNVIKGCIQNIKKEIFNFIEVEIIFGNVYNKFTNICEVDNLLHKNYRLISINMLGTNIFDEKYKKTFGGDFLYVSKKKLGRILNK